MNDKQRIETNLVVITERAPDVVGRFYTRLFARHPELSRLFGRRSRPAQEKMVLDAIVAVVEHMEDESWLRGVLRPLGAKHVSYGVTEGMYPLVAEALVATLADASGETWNKETENAWLRALGAVAGEMIAGAREFVDAEAASTARGSAPRPSQSPPS
jgi:hemoglobin-like flavoprotein